MVRVKEWYEGFISRDIGLRTESRYQHVLGLNSVYLTNFSMCRLFIESKYTGVSDVR